MMPYVATEDTLAEQPTLARLCDAHGAGWTHVHGPSLPRTRRPLSDSCGRMSCWSSGCGGRSRGSTRSCRRRPSQRVCELALTSTSPSVIEDHRGFHELLLSGVPVAYRRRATASSATITRGWSTSTSRRTTSSSR